MTTISSLSSKWTSSQLLSRVVTNYDDYFYLKSTCTGLSVCLSVLYVCCVCVRFVCIVLCETGKTRHTTKRERGTCIFTYIVPSTTAPLSPAPLLLLATIYIIVLQTSLPCSAFLFVIFSSTIYGKLHAVLFLASFSHRNLLRYVVSSSSFFHSPFITFISFDLSFVFRFN